MDDSSYRDASKVNTFSLYYIEGLTVSNNYGK